MSGVVNSVGKVIGTFTGATQQAKAAEKAANVQAGMAQEGMSEERRQFDKLVELMSPYVTAGKGAMEQQQALLGLSGEQSQQAAIGAIEKSPFFSALAQQGENALLQQASATGGLRGGNIQAALAQFRPGLLNQMVQQQMTNLGGLSQLGQASAAGQASQGMQSAGAIANLLAQQGAAQAGGIMAKGGLQRQVFGDLLAMAGAASKFVPGGGQGAQITPTGPGGKPF